MGKMMIHWIRKAQGRSKGTACWIAWSCVLSGLDVRAAGDPSLDRVDSGGCGDIRDHAGHTRVGVTYVVAVAWHGTEGRIPTAAGGHSYCADSDGGKALDGTEPTL